MSNEQSHPVPVDNSVSCMMQPFTSAERELRMFNAKHGYVTLSSSLAMISTLIKYALFLKLVTLTTCGGYRL